MISQRDSSLRHFLWLFIFLVVQVPILGEAQPASDDQARIGVVERRLNDAEQRLLALEKAMTSAQDSLAALAAIERATATAAATAQANPNITPEQKAYLRDVAALRTEFENIHAKMQQTAENVAATEMSISNQYFQIFALMIAVMAAVGALIAFVIRKTVTEAVMAKTEAAVARQINE